MTGPEMLALALASAVIGAALAVMAAVVMSEAASEWYRKRIEEWGGVAQDADDLTDTEYDQRVEALRHTPQPWYVRLMERL